MIYKLFLTSIDLVINIVITLFALLLINDLFGYNIAFIFGLALALKLCIKVCEDYAESESEYTCRCQVDDDIIF